MRISDWISDVCSSDLAYPLRVRPAPALGVRPALCGAAVAQRLARRAAERADRGARRMKGLIVAIQFLTRLPTPRIAVSAGEFAAWMKSEERRSGKMRVNTCSSRGSPYPSKTKQPSHKHALNTH